MYPCIYIHVDIRTCITYTKSKGDPYFQTKKKKKCKEPSALNFSSSGHRISVNTELIVVYCSVLQCIAVHCSVIQSKCWSLFQCVSFEEAKGSQILFLSQTYGCTIFAAIFLLHFLCCSVPDVASFINSSTKRDAGGVLGHNSRKK